MPLPKIGDVHVDAALTNISVAYMQDAKNFVASQVFPTVPVDFKSDKYFTYNKGDFRRNTAKPRAAGTESAGGGFRMSTDSYSCEVYALHKDVPDDIRNNADPAVDVDADAARWVTQQLLIQKEVQFATDYFATSIWGTDVVGGTDFTAWSDASSDPEADIDAGKSAILKSTGMAPNTLVVGYDVHQALKRHPLITERYKYTSPESITAQMIARFLELDRYLVAQASYNTAAEGATDVNAFILGSHALLAHVPSSPGLLVPAAGYTFVWRNLTGVNPNGYATSTFRMQHLKSDRVEGEFAYDHKVVASDMGYFFSGAAA